MIAALLFLCTIYTPSPAPATDRGCSRDSAVLLLEGRDFAQADEIFERCIRIFESDGDTGGLSWALRGLANSYLIQGRATDGIELLERRLGLVEKEHGRYSSPWLHSAQELLGAASATRSGERVDHLAGQLEEWSARTPPTREHAAVAQNLALHYESLGRLGEALQWLEKANKIYISIESPSENQALVLARMGDIEEKRGDHVAASKKYEESLATSVEGDLRVGLLERYAWVMARSVNPADHENALAVMNQATREAAVQYGRDSAEWRSHLTRLADFLDALGQPADAAEVRSRIDRLPPEVLGPTVRTLGEK